MKGSTNNMKRGAAAVLFSCLLGAASSVTAATEGLSVTTEKSSDTTVSVEVQNNTDSEISGPVDVRVVVSGVPMSVPVNVDLAPGGTARVTLDLSRLRLPVGPLSSILEGPTPF